MFDPRRKPERGTYEVDVEHPLAFRLEALWMFDDAGGVMVDALGRYPLRMNGNVPRVIAQGRSGLGYAGSDANYLLSAATYTAGNEITVSCNAYSSNFAQNGVLVDQAQGNQGFLLFFETSLKWRVTASATLAVTAPAAGWHHFAGTNRGTAGAVYTDGVVQTTGTTAQLDTTASAFQIGRFNSGIYPFTGVIGDVRIYRRALTPTEIAWLAAEPYAMLRPTVRRTYSVSSESLSGSMFLALAG